MKKSLFCVIFILFLVSLSSCDLSYLSSGKEALDHKNVEVTEGVYVNVCKKYNIVENTNLYVIENYNDYVKLVFGDKYIVTAEERKDAINELNELFNGFKGLLNGTAFSKNQSNKIKSDDEIIDWTRGNVAVHNQVRALGAGRTKINGMDVKILSTKLDGNKLDIVQLQPAGKKPMDWRSFVNGLRGAEIKIGE